MNTASMKAHTIFALVGAMSFLATSCTRSTTFSTVLEGGFDPEAAFRQHGYAVQNEARGEGIRNPQYGYGWRSWCGVLTRSGKPATSEAIAVVIRDEVNKPTRQTTDQVKGTPVSRGFESESPRLAPPYPAASRSVKGAQS